MFTKYNSVIILQQRMAGWLMFNGMKLIEVKCDLKNKKRDIYIFDDTPEVRYIMGKYNSAKEELLK